MSTSDGIKAIVAHDAGGAEILASYVRRLPPGERCVFALEGPARKVFARRLPGLDLLPLEEAVTRADRLLCGTGWQSDFELRAIRQARASSKPSVAFLDHWVNYRMRFVRGHETVLPDMLLVGDKMALPRARAELPELPVQLVENPYFLDLRDMLARPTRHDAPHAGINALFLCEPVREHALRQHGDERYWGYTEEGALAYFLDHLDALGAPVARIVVRSHPAEPPGKYDVMLRGYQLPIELSSAPDILDDIRSADWVAGCNTMGLVIALVAGRRALCCIPPGGRPCVLPHEGIVQLAALIPQGAPR